MDGTAGLGGSASSCHSTTTQSWRKRFRNYIKLTMCNKRAPTQSTSENKRPSAVHVPCRKWSRASIVYQAKHKKCRISSFQAFHPLSSRPLRPNISPCYFVSVIRSNGCTSAESRSSRSQLASESRSGQPRSARIFPLRPPRGGCLESVISVSCRTLIVAYGAIALMFQVGSRSTRC